MVCNNNNVNCNTSIAPVPLKYSSSDTQQTNHFGGERCNGRMEPFMMEKWYSSNIRVCTVCKCCTADCTLPVVT